ncbi:Golgi apparatus membrane protein TVP15 [Phytophthora cactorum]|nr:Golgi apparatus membrane protein TVP15 [Phytophthora cactorum]
MSAKSRSRVGLHQHSRISPKHNVHVNHQHEPFILIQNRSASGLRGVDLVEQVAQNTSIQRRRWAELYPRLWEHKTKIDIVDTILFVNGSPVDWYFTSAATGRLRARLVHEESGQLVCTPLRDGEISFVLSQPPSDLAVATMLLQPLLPSARQPTNARGTFVAKYNIAATSSCTRVLHLENGGLYGLLPSQASTANSAVVGAVRSKRPSSAPVTAQSHQLEEIIKEELRKLVHAVEAAFNDRVRLLTADFQITDMHRLVLVRVSGVVFFSDLVQKKEIPATTRRSAFEEGAGAQRRKSSVDKSCKCAGRVFCHCTDIVTAPGSNRPRSSKKQAEVCQITRKSISLSENETAFLKRFGAEAEATLRPTDSLDLTAVASWSRRGKSSSGHYSAVMKLLERRIFMLQNTLWNPKSDSFDSKALEFEDARWLPHEYEMVAVCQACNLIYQAIDDERFSRSRETAAAATRRSTELFRSKFLESERATIATLHRTPSSVSGTCTIVALDQADNISSTGYPIRVDAWSWQSKSFAVNRRMTSRGMLRLRVERVTKLVCTIRVLNLLTACLQFAAGVNSLVGIFLLGVTEFLIAVYAIVFALLLACFECHLSVTDNILRPNFGFLYGYRGMTTYLVFIGLMDLGMIGHVFGIIAGTLACINACLVVFVGVCAPRAPIDYPAVITSATAPSYGSTSQMQGPIAFALATGALKKGTSSPASVHVIV